MKNVANQKEGKKIGLFRRFIFWILIPLLFATFIALIILSVAGINVFQKIKEMSEKVPVISSMLEEKDQPNIEIYETKIDELDTEIQNNLLEIEQLQGTLDRKDQEYESLIVEKQNLEQTIEELRQIRDEQKRAFNEIVSTYETMSPKSSAAIILEMNDQEAMKILSNIGPEALAKVLEKMPPKDAAMYSEMLSASTGE